MNPFQHGARVEAQVPVESMGSMLFKGTNDAISTLRGGAPSRIAKIAGIAKDG